MRAVRVTEAFPGSVHEAETRWYDTAHWPDWIDGLERVVSVGADWPSVGSSVNWESGPAGRGRVLERVVAYEALVGQTLEVEDGSIRGRQSVVFTPLHDGVEIDLSLEYQLKKRSIVTPLVDLLFIRRAMAASLQSTLGRFALELGGRRDPQRHPGDH